MNILLAHNNFPGQFHRLSVELAADPQNKVVFLSHFRRQDLNVPGVNWIQVPRAAEEDTPNSARKKYLTLLAQGERFADAMVKLRNEGFTPHVVHGHVGFGSCMYAPDIFPHAMQMGYYEWYYSNNADTAFFAGNKPIPLNTMAENRQCNLCTLSALKECTVGISPTFWQRDQHPREFHYKLNVLHDGIDTQFFSPAKTQGVTLRNLDLSHAEEIVTYATRGLEPYRGFHTFYRALPAVLQTRPKAHIVIMADDRSAYGVARKDGKSWKQVLQEEVQVDESRVHFIPFQPYDQYLALLRASDVHVYLTAPFVLSWSMLEAMSCGCLLIASDTEPVREVVRDGRNGLLFNFWNAQELADRIVHCLANQKRLEPMRVLARKTIEAQYALHHLLPRHIEVMKAGILLRRSGR